MASQIAGNSIVVQEPSSGLQRKNISVVLVICEENPQVPSGLAV